MAWTTSPDCTGEKRLGLVFPVYAWGLPEPVERFAARLPRTAAFTFGVATCGSEAGHALKQLDKIFPLRSSYSLVMPNNYIAGADLDDDATARAKLDAAEKALAVMAEEIAAPPPPRPAGLPRPRGFPGGAEVQPGALRLQPF